jgi:hypothetical protein
MVKHRLNNHGIPPSIIWYKKSFTKRPIGLTILKQHPSMAPYTLSNPHRAFKLAITFCIRSLIGQEIIFLNIVFTTEMTSHITMVTVD